MDGHRRRGWAHVNNLNATPIGQRSVDVLLTLARRPHLQNESMTDVKLNTWNIIECL